MNGAYKVEKIMIDIDSLIQTHVCSYNQPFNTEQCTY